MTSGRRTSVILPAYNCAKFIEATIASIARQTWAPIELIVVDDGSRDETAEILRGISRGWESAGRKLVILQRENRGAASARNTALEWATGDYIAFADADDIWYADLLERLIEGLEKQPKLDLVFPRLRYVDHDGAPIGVESSPGKDVFRPVDLLIDNPIHSATGVIVRRKAMDEAGPFDTNLTACIDLDLWVRIGRLRPENIGAVHRILVDYRKRPGQITSDWRRMKLNWERVRDKLARSGRVLSRREARIARASNYLNWATLAYNAESYGEARHLIAKVWLTDPRLAATNRMVGIRTLACIASLLPPRAHAELRDRFNRTSRSKC